MKGDKMAKRSSFGSIVRKRLSDITNSLPQTKSPIHKVKLSPSASAKDYIDNLVKENMSLMKLIEDKNKIIELNGIELQKLRVNLQKIQLQNWNLAQSNSHIAAELKLGKERLKAQQHDLVCKDALLKAKIPELQEKEEAAGQCKSNDVNKPCNGNKRRTARSKSLGHSTTIQQVSEKERAENKRRCLRRQSASFKSQQGEPIENLFEIEDDKLPVNGPLNSSEHEDGPTQLDSSVEKEEKDETCARESQRTSFGRPLRKAVEKVQSYKEIRLNIKMRRPE